VCAGSLNCVCICIWCVCVCVCGCIFMRRVYGVRLTCVYVSVFMRRLCVCMCLKCMCVYVFKVYVCVFGSFGVCVCV
jgi:hypothetical protein